MMRRVSILARQVWTLRLAARLLSISALATLIGILAQASQAAQVIPSLAIEFPNYVEVGRPIDIVLTGQDMRDIGGYELTLVYDTRDIELNGLRLRNTDIRTAGRGVEPLIAERSDGLSIGVYSCPFAECVRPAPGSPRQSVGASGTVGLAEVILIRNAPGVFEINLADAKFVSADGTVINVAMPVETLRIEVGLPDGRHYPAPTPPLNPGPQPITTPPGPFDLTRDGQVNYADSVIAAVDWTMLRFSGVICEPGAQRADDVNHDGCLDITDLQMLTHHFSDPPGGLTETPSHEASVTATATMPLANTPTATVVATTTPTDTPTMTTSSTPELTSTVTATPDKFSPSHAVYLPHIVRASLAPTAPLQTPTASPSPTDLPITTATVATTPELTETPTATATQAPTNTPTEALSATPSPTSALTSTAVATADVTETPTPPPSSTGTATAMSTPTGLPSLTSPATLTATVIATIIPTALPTSTPELDVSRPLYAMDSFDRQVSKGWGVAEQGGQYTLHGAAAGFGVNGTVATVLMAAPGTEQRAELLSLSALNVDAAFRVRTNKLAFGGGQSAYLAARRVGPGDLYLGRIRFINNEVELVAYRLLAGEETRLSAPVVVPQLRHVANTYTWVRTQVSGVYPTTIKMRAWANDQYEPGDWQYSVADQEPRLQFPGAVGLRTYVSLTALNAPIIFTFDDFVVNQVLTP